MVILPIYGMQNGAELVARARYMGVPIPDQVAGRAVALGFEAAVALIAQECPNIALRDTFKVFEMEEHAHGVYTWQEATGGLARMVLRSRVNPHSTITLEGEPDKLFGIGQDAAMSGLWMFDRLENA